LAGFPVTDVPSMERAGEKLLEQGAGAALMKGGHLRGSHVVDILVTAAGTQKFVHSRLNTTSTHGTGCTLSAAIAGGLAKRIGGWTAGGRVPPDALATAVSDALDYVHRAISTARPRRLWNWRRGSLPTRPVLQALTPTAVPH
jgi:hydroxymethylpyrimidine/phosphomethylpyrimidine kinase